MDKRNCVYACVMYGYVRFCAICVQTRPVHWPACAAKGRPAVRSAGHRQDAAR